MDGIISNAGGFRCLIDPDDRSRCAGPVESRKMTPEEIIKYGPANIDGERRSYFITGKKMKEIRKKEKMNYGNVAAVITKKQKAKITKEQLIEEIRTGGFHIKNYKRIAEKYNYKGSDSISALISYYNIKYFFGGEKS